MTTGPTDSLLPDNPFAAPSDLPFGLPPFARIRTEHYLPAFEAGMAEQRAEIEAIATSSGPATVENTLEALERSGRLLHRVGQVFFNLTSSSATAELNEIETDVAPRLAAHTDAIYLDSRLFARVDALHSHSGDLEPGGEQQRLLDRYHKDFVRAGAGLDDAQQERLRAINAELAGLTTAFKNDLLADTVDLAVHVATRDELDGLGDGAIAAAAEAAKGRGLQGYLLTIGLPSGQPELESLTHRGLRERLHRASVSRGARGNAHDTRATLTRIVALRAERAGLLGYTDHASYVIEDETARTLPAVDAMLGGLVGPAVTNAFAEAAELEAALLADGESAPLQPWDWAYYAGTVREQRFSLDTAALRPYFELGRVVTDGIFYAAEALYGLTFQRRTDLAGYDDDVQVYEVRAADGGARGLFLADWYTRDTKRGGAWMSTFVDQSHLLDEAPVVVINLNIPRPPDGEPTLLTLDELITAFHEFGHVLHGLLSDVRYPLLSGTNVPRDFVEFPSQVNEMWAYWPQVLANYAVHHETGERLPQEVVDALIAARSYGEGFSTTEYLAAALLDLAWHRLTPAEAAALGPDDVAGFERDALQRNGVAVDLIPPRYRSTYFAHIFSGGYSAGYYSYIWSEVLDADTVEWFTENGGLRRENGERFADRLLSRGGSVDPLAAFEAVRGRPPRIEPLLARRGLAPHS
ncbi:MAG: M3 family metallopeptidase [Kineosporiaceae bacterium]